MGFIDRLRGLFFGKLNRKTTPAGTVEKEFGVRPAASRDMEDNINLWWSLYVNRPTWETCDVRPLGLPSAIGRELARNTMTEFSVSVSGSARAEYINQQMQVAANKFCVNLERGLCLGGVALKPYQDGPLILVEEFTTGFTPTHFDGSDKCIGGVFKSAPVRKGNEWFVRMEYHDFLPREDGSTVYVIENKAFRSGQDGGIGAQVPLNTVDEWSQIFEHVEIESLDGPLFAYFKPPVANNVEPESKMGLSVYAGATVDLIKQADEMWEQLFWEYKSGERKIYVDRERKLEFLTVGDYGKENNIKADFLGLHKEIHGVQHHDVDLTQKWVATISTQKGCPMRCQFCDCPKFGYHGDVSRNELAYEVETILQNEDVRSTSRFNVHFARMGEPTWNNEVLAFAENDLRELVAKHIVADTVHPVVSTMLPRHNKGLEKFILDFCRIKNEVYGGEAGLQFSINSTDSKQRNVQFDNMSLSLEEISTLAHTLPRPAGRKYTLNFAVTEETILDAGRLSELFDKDNFVVKITPIHKTVSAIKNGFSVTTEYTDYDVYRKFESPLVEAGWDVIVFIPSEEEDSDRITCGNAIITKIGET